MASRTRPRSKNSSLPHSSPAIRSTKELFAAAVRHHLANELDAAEKSYRTVLSLEPKFPEALNNLGALVRHRDAAVAHTLFERAAAARPNYTDGLFNLGLSFMTRGELLRSGETFRSILAFEPNNGRAWNELTSVLRGLGEFDESLAAARRAVELLPNDAATHNNLGNVLLQSGHLEEARACYERALSIFADYPEAINNLGTVYRGMRRPDLALPMFLRALELRPGYVDAMHNMSLGLPPNVPGAELVEGRLIAEVEHAPDAAEPLGVLAIYLQEKGRFDEARALAEEVIRRDERNIDGWTVLGICAAEAVDLSEAIRCYDRALELDSRAGVVRWNRSIALLGLGNYEEGWKAYESRWQLVHMAHDRRLVDRAEWNGEALDDKTIIVYTEQGLGDAIQFARFGAELKRRHASAHIVVECDQSLTSLFDTCDWVDGTVARGAERPAFDTHVALLSLPRIFNVTLDNLSTAPAFRIAKRAIASRIQKRDGEVNVGIVWGGRSPNPALARRSIPLELFAPLAEMPNVRLHSLQVGDNTGQLERCSFRDRIDDLAPHIKDFVDTAAVMQELDLVITIDTSVAHLAGAFGVPVWVMLIRNADWRWLLDRSDSPWYPSARLFRQATPGDWTTVAADVAASMQEAASSATSAKQLEAAPAKNETMVAELASLQKHANGTSRFNLSIPLPMLADPATFATYAVELTGEGVDAEARAFLDDELRSTDVFIDYSAGIGLTTLGAATAPNAPALVVAVTENTNEANVIRNAARNVCVDASVFAHARNESVDVGIDALLSRHALEASRVMVRVQRVGEVMHLLPTAAESLTQGRIAAIIWNLRGPAMTSAEWGDQLTIDGLTSLGFQHFELGEDENGRVLNALGATPASRTVFSILVERFAKEPESATAEATIPVIGMDWQVGATSGWGVYGQNLSRRLLETGAALPTTMYAPAFDGMKPATIETLAPIVATNLEFTSALAEKQGQTLHVPFTMLRALGNGLQITSSSAQVDAPRNVGVVFFESTDLDRAAIERAKRFDRIIAGSTWNAEVLRAHGVDNVVTVLQGIDASQFKPRSRKSRRKNQFVVFSGGKLEYRKGQDIVVAAFREFVKRHPEAKLMVAWHNHWPQTMNEITTAGLVRGVPCVDAMGRVNMRRWLENNGIPSENVVDLGLRGNAEMASLIAEADVALFTNRAEGGTNLVAMETLAAGVPAILSANTGHLDLTDESRCFVLGNQGLCKPTTSFTGVDGWGETPVDGAVKALELVYANSDEAARRAANAAAWMRGLSWDSQIDKLYEAISDLV
ncbi:MAG TPA: tetratricopeptide repeat protein [Gemmatimonadaceae bacterium]|jgi:tetratricopeptide (TPR) repeat protein/glycosyltransferase involved in cell wall biosynthesis